MRLRNFYLRLNGNKYFCKSELRDGNRAEKICYKDFKQSKTLSEEVDVVKLTLLANV